MAIKNLIKLLVAGALGYLAYEYFFVGKRIFGGARQARGREQFRSEVPTQIRGSRLEKTEDSTGASIPHRVGRGVI